MANIRKHIVDTWSKEEKFEMEMRYAGWFKRREELGLPHDLKDMFDDKTAYVTVPSGEDFENGEGI